MSIADLVTLSVLQAITPSLREAVSAIARGDRKGRSIADLVTLSVLQAITPSPREAVSAIARGDRKCRSIADLPLLLGSHLGQNYGP